MLKIEERHKAMAKPLKTKFGIIVMLDALGTRTAHIDQARAYISSLRSLRRDAELTMRISLENHPPEQQNFYKKLSISYFGDTVLLTYEVLDINKITTYIEYIYNILSYFFLTAIEKKILFRGAISIGEYIQQEKVVLGTSIDRCSFVVRFG